MGTETDRESIVRRRGKEEKMGIKRTGGSCRKTKPKKKKKKKSKGQGRWEEMEGEKKEEVG